MLRVSGYDTDKVKAYAQQIAARIAKDPNTENVFLNWDQKNKIMHVDLRIRISCGPWAFPVKILPRPCTYGTVRDGRPTLCGR